MYHFPQSYGHGQGCTVGVGDGGPTRWTDWFAIQSLLGTAAAEAVTARECDRVRHNVHADGTLKLGQQFFCIFDTTGDIVTSKFQEGSYTGATLEPFEGLA